VQVLFLFFSSSSLLSFQRHKTTSDYLFYQQTSLDDKRWTRGNSFHMDRPHLFLTMTRLPSIPSVY
jgi:hypothetical protein